MVSAMLGRRWATVLALGLLAACQSVPQRAAVDTPDVASADAPALELPETTEPAAPPLPPSDSVSASDATSAIPPLLPGDIGQERTPVPVPVPEPPPAQPEPDLWQQMRSGFALPGCDYAPDTEHWARRYAASPRRFAAVLDELLPALEYTHRQVQQAQLPSEFALLPIVESHFRPHPARYAQPAGIWQIVGDTGRSAGLRVDDWIDGRLNLAASTDAALQLLDRYGDYFQDDWRLAVFAYNAGEFRVRRALERHRPDDSFADLRGLGLAKGSYEYLTKLLALACLVREPERFDLALPVLQSERRLQRVELDGVIGGTLAHALSGLSADEFARFNAGLRRDRTPPGERFALLVRAPQAERAPQLLAQLPASQRIGWHRRALAGGESLADIAAEHGLLPATLLALNNVAETDTAPASGRFWLPGRPAPAGAADLPAEVHVVRSGDSLWTIARRHGLTVSDLLRYNGLDNSRLMPGQRLRLSAP